MTNRRTQADHATCDICSNALCECDDAALKRGTVAYRPTEFTVFVRSAYSPLDIHKKLMFASMLSVVMELSRVSTIYYMACRAETLQQMHSYNGRLIGNHIITRVLSRIALLPITIHE